MALWQVDPIDGVRREHFDMKMPLWQVDPISPTRSLESARHVDGGGGEGPGEQEQAVGDWGDRKIRSRASEGEPRRGPPDLRPREGAHLLRRRRLPPPPILLRQRRHPPQGCPSPFPALFVRFDWMSTWFLLSFLGILSSSKRCPIEH